MIKLSICIPTYNRGTFISETIESIISQATNEIEIVISDNGSDDNTVELIKKYQNIFSRIIFFRWETNVGADKNFLKVIDISNGEYCWFMGSDDRIEQGAIQHILSQLNKYPTIAGASVNQTIYSPDLVTKINGVPVAGGSLNTDKLFNDAELCFKYLGLYFGYLPGQIVNRKLWNKIISVETLHPYFNAFVHVYVIGRMLQINPQWLYIHKKCVGYRSGNDSFLQDVGIYKRQVIAHANFETIVRDLYGKNKDTYKAVLKMALTGYMRGDLAGLKKNGASINLQFNLFLLYVNLYWQFPYFWTNVVPLFLIPNIFFTKLMNIRKYLLRCKGILK